MKNKIRIKDWLIFLMLISFLVLVTTGLLKYKAVDSLFSLSDFSLPLAKIATYHQYSALLLVLLVIIHILFQKAWWGRFFSALLKRQKLKIFLFGALFLWLCFLVYRYLDDRGILFYRGVGDQVNRLAAVEVTQYEGENLSSIKDFRENSIKGPQEVDIDHYQLKISGLVERPVEFSYEMVLDFPSYEKVVTLNCVEGWRTKILWEGVLIKSLLAEAKVKEEANTVIFHAYDGYTSSLSLDDINQKGILLAYKMNGVTLPLERGFPFQVVAEDKWGYKWVKWVTEIEVSDNQDYQGYWESAGYNRNGDVQGPRFED